jgi:hypothetical protein
MTQPINWDQVANALVYSKGKANNWFWDASLGVADIAAALRDAEKAGMERAAVKVAEKLESAFGEHTGKTTNRTPKVCQTAAGKVVGAIRAAKETKE